MKFVLLHRIYYWMLGLQEKNRQKKWIQKLREQDVRGLQKCNIGYNCQFEGKNAVGFCSILKATDVGFASYIGADCFF